MGDQQPEAPIAEQQLPEWVVSCEYTLDRPLFGSDTGPKTYREARIVEAVNEDAAAWVFTRRCSVLQLTHLNTIDVRPIAAPSARYFAQYEGGDSARRLVVTADERREVPRAS